MGRKRIIRPGLDEFIKENYGKVKNSVIAEKFYVTPDYVKLLAKRMGLARKNKMPEGYVNNVGLPAGYTKQNIVAETATGQLLKKGNVLRHVMR